MVNDAKDMWLCGPCNAKGTAFQLAAFLAGHDPSDKSKVLDWCREHGLMNGNGHSPATQASTIVDTYDYRDEHGTGLYQAVRLAPKSFRQRRPDGQGGHVWDMNGVRLVPYALERLVDSTPAVYVAEGEKDAERLWALGVPATCNVGGAGKWRDAYTQNLVTAAGVRHAYVLRDHDVPGHRHGIQVATSLHAAGVEVRMPSLSGLHDGPPATKHGRDVSNWLDAGHSADELRALAEATPIWTPDSLAAVFCRVDEGHYRFTLAGLEFTIDRLRRRWDELIGELTVRCDLPGARTVDGVLSVADFNLSNLRAREERSRYLEKRANVRDLDWAGLLEELVQRVQTAERAGQPAVSLRSLPRPIADDTIEIDGLRLIDRHPMILFGDGGAAKSYLALYLAGRLALLGIRTALFDWELAGEDHRDRLERLFGADMPDILYVRCNRPLVHEADRLRRIVRDADIGYAFYDSIAFACDGPPEAAEVAGRYFQAVRQIAVGSLHVAHVSKADGADQKPFGSTFWANGARATWNVKLADSLPGGNQITIGLYNRKANLGGLKPPIGFEITFESNQALIRRVNVADNADLAGHLSVRQRMAHLLRRGAMSPDVVADEIQADVETIKRTVRRYKQQFTVIPGGHVALCERRAS